MVLATRIDIVMVVGGVGVDLDVVANSNVDYVACVDVDGHVGW